MNTIIDMTYAALIELHRRSIEERDASFRTDSPPWLRDRLVERHDAIVRELIRRGLLSSRSADSMRSNA